MGLLERWNMYEERGMEEEDGKEVGLCLSFHPLAQLYSPSLFAEGTCCEAHMQQPMEILR